MSLLRFTIEKKLKDRLGRAALLETPHGSIKTPSFVVVGTKGTVKAVTPAQLQEAGVQVVLANTYHLYLQPGDDLVAKAGGLQSFMNWHGPTMTDSGGFQVFSLGEAYGKNITKLATGDFRQGDTLAPSETKELSVTLVKIEEDGVWFKSIIDGSSHFFTPEKSIGVQHNLGADMIFAFDECTSPLADYDYQTEAMRRTHEWALRSLYYHKNSSHADTQGLFGIVQGGRFVELRQESARFLSKLDFDGFGIGGSFTKEDIALSVDKVNVLLPEEKPRHLLGIGEPEDLFAGIENGVDLFDCVSPTRLGRTGTLYTSRGKINILNASYIEDFSPVDSSCSCYACTNYTKAYLSHLFRAKEMLGATLASIHNIYFLTHLVDDIRTAILNENFFEFKEHFFENYKS